MAVCALGLVGSLLYHRAVHRNYFLGAFTFFRQNPLSELSARVAAHARPGEAIAIWGWSSYVYVETGLRQASREAHFGGAIAPGGMRTYFRERLLADFMQTNPAMFLDSVGPCSLGSPPLELFSHERYFPELAAVIRANYLKVDEVTGARIYRRRDLLPPVLPR